MGGHNFDNFKNTFTKNGWNLDDCTISKNPHSNIDEIYEIKYGLPALDREGNIITGQLKNVRTPKTVYDPKIISNEQMINWGKEAMANGTKNGRVFTGQASNGLKFQRFIDEATGEITNFYPTLE